MPRASQVPSCRCRSSRFAHRSRCGGFRRRPRRRGDESSPPSASSSARRADCLGRGQSESRGRPAVGSNEGTLYEASIDMFPKGGCLKSTFMWPIDGDLSLAVTSAGDGVEKLRFILAETKIHRLILTESEKPG